jgi:hypothetical protein
VLLFWGDWIIVIAAASTTGMVLQQCGHVSHLAAAADAVLQQTGKLIASSSSLIHSHATSDACLVQCHLPDILLAATAPDSAAAAVAEHPTAHSQCCVEHTAFQSHTFEEHQRCAEDVLLSHSVCLASTGTSPPQHVSLPSSAFQEPYSSLHFTGSITAPLSTT